VLPFRKIDLIMIRVVVACLVGITIVAGLAVGLRSLIPYAVIGGLWIEASIQLHQRRVPFYQTVITLGHTLVAGIPLIFLGRYVNTASYLYIILIVYITMLYGRIYGLLALGGSAVELVVSMVRGWIPMWGPIEFLFYLLSQTSAMMIITVLVHYTYRNVQMAIKDGLTGVFNHRHFQERLESLIKQSRVAHTPFSVVLADIDRFKHFNDTYGHSAGDRVLQLLGTVLREAVGSQGEVFRYGGEEFAFLLFGKDAAAAEALIQSVREQVGNTLFPFEKVTLSYGIAAYPQHGLTRQELVARADAAMYQAKKTRDNVCIAETDDATPSGRHPEERTAHPNDPQNLSSSVESCSTLFETERS
jgi:diguanylate cyclase (GGDEF)-like protein